MELSCIPVKLREDRDDVGRAKNISRFQPDVDELHGFCTSDSSTSFRVRIDKQQFGKSQFLRPVFI